MRLPTTILLGLLLGACPGAGADDGDDDDTRGGDLIDHDRWVAVSAADDPFEDRPTDVACSDGGWGNEDIGGEASLEIGTDACGYLTVSQPALVSGLAGDELHLRLWHYELLNVEPAEAHAAVMIGGEVVWEVTHDIPADSGIDAPYWEAGSDFAVGDEVVFHLHNHGSNTWNFIELSAARP